MHLRQQVELTLLTGIDDTTAVIEWQARGTRFNEVTVAASWHGARAWVESRYEGVEWDGPISGRALIGVLAEESS